MIPALFERVVALGFKPGSANPEEWVVGEAEHLKARVDAADALIARYGLSGPLQESEKVLMVAHLRADARKKAIEATPEYQAEKARADLAEKTLFDFGIDVGGKYTGKGWEWDEEDGMWRKDQGFRGMDGYSVYRETTGDSWRLDVHRGGCCKIIPSYAHAADAMDAAERGEK
jgi:hypothetical protein